MPSQRLESRRRRVASKKPVWETKDPTKKDKPLGKKAKASAKAKAKAAGRPYPNLVDNMNAAKKKKNGK